MLIAERFLSCVVRYYENHPVSTDGGTWYPQACEFLKMDHHIHYPLEKSHIERKIQYIKNRIECFDDYFPFKLENYKLKHVKNWSNLFVNYHNKEMIND
jgi:putative transposase